MGADRLERSSACPRDLGTRKVARKTGKIAIGAKRSMNWIVTNSIGSDRN